MGDFKGMVAITVIYVMDYYAFVFTIPNLVLGKPNFVGNVLHRSTVDNVTMSRCIFPYVITFYSFNIVPYLLVNDHGIKIIVSMLG